jgi:hypothetical protein
VFKLITVAVAGFLALAVALGGASAADNARVRVIHASPDAPAVDVYANGARVLSNVPFKASSGYLSVPAGSYTFQVYPAGSGPAAASPVLTVSADLKAGTDYTVMAVDSLSQIKGRVFVDNNAAPAAGTAHVSVIHAGPNAPAVDVAVKDGPVLISNLGFGTPAGPLPVAAGKYDLEVRVAGTNTVALPLPGIELRSGVIYTFVATGYLDKEPTLTVVPFTESAAPLTPPSAGDAGLLDAESGGVSYLILAAIAGAAATGVLFSAKLAGARIRK